MKQASKVGTMYEELHKAARECNVGVFKTYNDNKCLFQDMNGKNILHIATQHCNRQQDNFYLHFIKEAIRRYPKLMYQRDCNDDTPLHVAARVDYGEKLLQESIKYWHTKGNENNDWKDLGMPPWKVKNLRGMTEAISDVNEHGETCLHLIAKYTRQPKGDIG
ncbi:Serine/threonine-protein phosphatase 6 regulatory ankyrin repeat subunit A [Bienertia sinuspersici]